MINNDSEYDPFINGLAHGIFFTLIGLFVIAALWFGIYNLASL